MILEAVDRMSGPARRVLAGVRNMARGIRDLVRGGAAGGRALDRLRAMAGRLRGGLGTLMTRIRQVAGRAGLRAIELAGYGAGRAIGWTIRKVAGLAVGLVKLTAGAMGLTGGGFFTGVIAMTAKFEQFQIMLEGTEGSVEKAKKAMSWVQDFAKTTPYELEQVMQAFIQLKAYGIDPLDGSLVAAGDAASGMSKDLMQAVEALADAQTGEFERLKEFGIRARSEGNKVTFTYMKNGKEISRQTSQNAAEMKAAITGIWSDRFGGSMARQSKTFNGMISNLKDGWSDFLLRVGQAGVFDKVKGKLQGVLDWLNGRLEDGSIEKWAQRVSDEMEKVVDWVGQFTEKDWQRFASDLWGIAKACWSIAKAFADAVNWASKLINTQDQIKQNGATTTVDGGSWFSIRRANEEPAAPKKPASPVIKSSPRATPINLRGTPIVPRGTPINPRASTAAPQKVAVGGKLEVELKAPPGWTAVPTRMTSVNPGVPVSYRGKANGGYG